MATKGTLLPLLLFALALMAGIVLLDGVNCNSTFTVHGREAVEAATVTCTKYSCPNRTIPNCCINPAPALYCTNFQTDSGDCGGCMTKCSFAAPCCYGKCTPYQIDPKNCGSCSHHCRKGETCSNGMCTSK